MSRSKLTENICGVPELYEQGEESTASLMKKAGILDMPVPLQTREIREVLTERPELASGWFKRVKDQRLSDGWVMDCVGDQFLLRNVATGVSQTFSDRIEACAAFIAGYVSRIRDVQMKYRAQPV
jgi:hypothetical protein